MNNTNNSTSGSSFSNIDAAASGTNSGREARNLAEKHRRDKLNTSIHELSTMVPHVAESTRRQDKTAVLRFAAHGLRLRYVFGKSAKKCTKKEPNSKPQFTDTLMQLLDSFFITVTCHGQIVLVSPSIEHLLGHCQSDLYGQNLLQITHPDDQTLLKQQLIPNDLETLFRLAHEDYMTHSGGTTTLGEERANCDDGEGIERIDENDEGEYQGPPSPRTLARQAYIDERLRDDRRCFTVRLARAGTRTEAARSYEIVKIDGCFRRSDCTPSSGNYPIVSQLIRRARGQHMQHEAIAQAALHGISGNDIVLVAMGRIIRPSKALTSIHVTSKLEYKTRHLIDGRIIDCDQRIGVVAGYMKDEVTNLSPFSFMHQDDVRWVIVALRQMYDCNSDYGESCYRLLSRNGHFIYLQTKGYMEIDKNTNKVHSFVCVNTLLDEEDGKQKVLDMKNKFSTIINTKIPSSSLVDVPASQNPQQLEKIVLCLIENLQRSDEFEAGYCNSAPFLEQARYTRTPPMALVPPERASVKHSITQSVSVVSSTAAKNLLHNQQSPSSRHSDVSLSPSSCTDEDNNIEECHHSVAPTALIQQQRPSVLKLSSKKPLNTTPAATSSIIVYNGKQENQNNEPAINLTVDKSNNNSQHEESKQTLQQQISVLKRLHATSATITSNSQTGSDILSPAKRTANNIQQLQAATTHTDIHNVLSTSLQKLDHTLYTIGNDTIALYDKHEHLKPHVPHAINQKLDEIIVEQQKQKKILVNIKSEYDVHKVQQQQQQQQDVVSSIRLSRITQTSTIATQASPANLVLNKKNNNNGKLKITMLTQRKPS